MLPILRFPAEGGCFRLQWRCFIAAGFTALLISCSASTDLKESDSGGNTPLHYALFRNDAAEAKRLIEAGAEVNAPNSRGLTPLMCAALHGNMELIELLLQKGASADYSSVHKVREPVPLKGNIVKYREQQRNFLLTFDTGSDDANLEYILRVLKKYRIKGTFFTTGEFIERYPEAVKRIYSEGHVVGNHTFSHSMNYTSREILLNELYETEYLFSKVTGGEIARIWRAPGLQHIYKPWMLKEAEKLGYRHIDVSLGAADWIEMGGRGYLNNKKFMELFKKGFSIGERTNAVIDGENYHQFTGRGKKGYQGVIMLMHAGSFRKKGEDFAFNLEGVILHLLSEGYLFDNCARLQYSD